ncbi:flagellar assembly protein T N-terminal domain-containing protein [Marinomonas epiphytica]
MRQFLKQAICISVFALLSVGSWAASVEAVGEAVIYNDDLVDARYRATEQAIKQAVLESSSRVSVKDSLINGELESSVEIRSAGHVQKARVVSEQRNGDILTVIARVEVTADSQCSTGHTHYYKKAVGITGFDLQAPQQARLGELSNIARELPKSLADEINQRGFLRALSATNFALYPDLINSPTSNNFDGSLSNITLAGEKLGVQYLISGVIRDISPVYLRSPDDKDAEAVPLDSKERKFVVDIYLYDSFSGELLFQERYNESGNWDISDHARVGFGTARFWSTHYGKVVEQAIKKSALDTSEKLRCQPFMANVFRIENNRIHIDAGSLAGIKQGDKFNVYRRYEVFDRLQTAQTQLNNANISVTIKQVQPNFSIGELAVDAKILNVQQRDVVIAW